MRKTATIVDLFCGGGGESVGIAAAYDRCGLDVELHAVNHWERAIETHAAHFPGARHYCAGVESLDPCRVVRSGRVDLLWASPECTHHSQARGGRPRSDQSRASAWLILKWLQELYVRRVIVENVPEFLSWGPLDSRGQPMQGMKGETFEAWVKALQSLGYRVEWRILNAADYGAPTTRRRVIVQAVRGSARIVWPEPTHCEAPATLFADVCRRWRAAAEVIDWDRPGESIADRERPLAEATLRRIETGIRRYWGEWAEPFLVILRGQSEVRRLNAPAPTVSCSGAHLGLVEPFLCRYNGGMTPGGCRRVHGVADPLPAVDTRNRYALVCPYYGKDEAGPVCLPLRTVTARDRFALVKGEPATLDIRFRMLLPHELAGAQGFPEGYAFAGTREEQVRQIGNAVCPPVAEALAAAGM